MFAKFSDLLATANMRIADTRAINFVQTSSKPRWFSAAKSFVDYSTKQPARPLGMHLT